MILLTYGRLHDGFQDNGRNLTPKGLQTRHASTSAFGIFIYTIFHTATNMIYLEMHLQLNLKSFPEGRRFECLLGSIIYDQFE